MKVYFVRHGESEANVSKNHSGPSTPLTETGAKQARIVADRLKDVDPDLILCSRYTRAMQTARVIGKVLGKKIVYAPVFNEWQLPSEINHLDRKSRKAEKILTEVIKHSEDPNWHYSDEETTFEVVGRAEKALKYLSKRKEEKVVVVSHAAFISAVLHLAIFGGGMNAGKLRHTFVLFKISNTGITELEIEEGKVKRIITINDHAHLK